MTKIDSIQDLRGIAVLYVVFFHAGMICNLQVFSHGATGVSLFFVISGFIISLIHKNDTGIPSAITFLKKRIARIYFPFIPILLISIGLFLVTGKGDEYHKDVLNIARNFLLIQAPSQSIHPYSWSLVFEVYYYATFCLIVILFRVNIFIYALIMSAIPLVSIFFLNIEVSKDMVPLSFSNLFFCAGAIIGGMFEKIKIKFNSIAALASLIMFIITPFFDVSGIAFVVITTLLFITYAKSNLSNIILREIGNASYSIYLVHAIVLMLLKTIIQYKGIPTFIILVSSSIALGYLYYIYIEKTSTKFAYNVLRIHKSH